MKIKALIVLLLLAIPMYCMCQDLNNINKTDQHGKKQGKWIKKYPDGTVMYEGTFVDNHPVGEFRRFFDSGTLKSFLVYNTSGTEALATMYHDNGYLSSKGKYKNQKKEGPWLFYSSFTEGYLLSEENYSANLRNGQSLKYYPDKTVAERIFYKNDLKQGEWTQYYRSGKICLRSGFLNDKVNGKYEVLYENGKLQFAGQYKNDVRDGTWLIYNKDGSVKYKLEYQDGIQTSSRYEIDSSEYLDSLERNIGKIADPEKTGIMNP
jgi:antitoxin component YwqK of YwqJK toxin-antitoxin module